jgi:hypothetical protein
MSRRKQLRFAAAAAVSVALLVPLTVYGGTGFAKSSSAAQYQYKITICHHTGSKTHPTVTISVGSSAWPAHQRHHDTPGACPLPVRTAAATAASSSTDDNKGNGNASNGNSHGNGKAEDTANNNGKANGHSK